MTTAPFRGAIDEVALFERALSEAEVQAIWRAGFQGKCKDGCPDAADSDADGLGAACDNCPNQ